MSNNEIIRTLVPEVEWKKRLWRRASGGAPLKNLPPVPPAMLTGVAFGPDGSLSFNITNVGVTYYVQASTNLAHAAGWVTLSTNTAPFTFADNTATAGGSMRFYRVVSP